MKNFTLLTLVMTLLFLSHLSVAQNGNSHFKMEGKNPETLDIGKTFQETTEIYPFNENSPKIYGLSVSAMVQLINKESVVRIILVDKNFNEQLVYETYPLIASASTVTIDDLCEETALLDGIKAYALRVEIVNASVQLNHVTYARTPANVADIGRVKKEKKEAQNEDKIQNINRNLIRKGTALESW